MEKLSVIKKFGNIRDYSKFFIFELLIHNQCDHNCSYCYMRNEDNTWGSSAPKNHIFSIYKIFKKINSYYPIKVCLSGGEALLHPDIFEIVEMYFKNFNKEIFINTNLSNSFIILEKLLKKYKDFKFNLFISWHPNQNKNFIKNIKRLQKYKNFKADINYMIDPQIKKEIHIKNLKELKNNIELKNINIFIKFIYINNKFKLYKNAKFSNEEKQILKSIIDKEYFLIDQDDKKILLDEIDILELRNKNFLNFKKYNCFYTFFTINAFDFKIKQMCKNFKIENILKDFNFFIHYSKKINKFKCPHEQCLWPSALDMVKEKHVLQ